MDKGIFIDTSFFKALVDKQDEFYPRAVKIWKKLQVDNPPLFTSNYILDEAFTLIRLRCGLEKVTKFRNLLAESSPQLKIIRVMVVDESTAWKWFLKNWSGLSFTDCITFAVMNRLGLKEVVTFDRHFIKAGFQIVK